MNTDRFNIADNHDAEQQPTNQCPDRRLSRGTTKHLASEDPVFDTNMAPCVSTTISSWVLENCRGRKLNADLSQEIKRLVLQRQALQHSNMSLQLQLYAAQSAVHHARMLIDTLEAANRDAVVVPQQHEEEVNVFEQRLAYGDSQTSRLTTEIVDVKAASATVGDLQIDNAQLLKDPRVKKGERIALKQPPRHFG